MLYEQAEGNVFEDVSLVNVTTTVQLPNERTVVKKGSH